MATRSGIAVRAGETFQTIYCHWDGHPREMYPILSTYYNTEELALKLISFGDANCIEKNLEPTGDYHKFGMPEPNVCMFYHRDMGEDWLSCQPACYIWSELHRQPSFEWVYIFEYGQWNVYRKGRKVDLDLYLGGK